MATISKPIILHFDLNGTIIPFDSTEDITKDQLMNLLIAKSMYGAITNVVDGTYSWEPNSDNKSMSYYEYAKRYDHVRFKDLVHKFTEEGEPGHQFRNLYDELMETCDPMDICSSFIRVLHAFPNAKIVFRTFGADLDSTIKTLVTKYGYGKPLTGCRFIRTKSEQGESVLLEVVDRHEYVVGAKQIYEFIRDCPTDFAITDDYKYWHANHKSPHCGKLMMINDGECFQRFFDDNDCVDLQDQDGQPMEETDKNIRKDHVIRVNTVSAIMDSDYFVKIVANALA